MAWHGTLIVGVPWDCSPILLVGPCELTSTVGTPNSERAPLGAATTFNDRFDPTLMP